MNVLRRQALERRIAAVIDQFTKRYPETTYTELLGALETVRFAITEGILRDRNIPRDGEWLDKRSAA
jgi:hypothetical protein